MRLREYQHKAVEAALADLDEVAWCLLVMATGLGKTVTFSHVARRFAERGRVMVLAHREELIRQAADKLARVTGQFPGRRDGGGVGGQAVPDRAAVLGGGLFHPDAGVGGSGAGGE